VPIIIIILALLNKYEICYYVNDLILTPLNLEFIDCNGILGRIFFFILANTAFIVIFNNSISKDWKLILLYLIGMVGWIISWKSPFSEGKKPSVVLNNNRNWYYNDFVPVSESSQSGIGYIIPESHKENQNFISFSRDSIFITQKINAGLTDLFYQISEKYSLEGNKIQLTSTSIKVNSSLKGIKDIKFIKIINNPMDISYLSLFPTISNEIKEKIKKQINSNFLFQNLGKMNFYIADVNNRGGDYTFDCFYFKSNKELYYTKFCEVGYFHQVYKKH
jgi:hypothetical protein